MLKGHEWFKAELDLYLWEIAGKYKVKIEMVDFAGNELDPPYEEEVDGRFGGVLRMLEALWEFICAVVSAIVEAVMAALSFIFELILQVIKWIIKAVIDPVISALAAWMTATAVAIDYILDTTADAFEIGASNVCKALFEGAMFYALLAIGIAVQVVATIVSLYTGGSLALLGPVVEKVVSQLILEVVTMTLVSGAIAAGTIVAVATILYLVFPSEDQFWVQGKGLTALKVVTKIPLIIKGLDFNRIFSKLDALGMALFIMGLLLQIAGGVNSAWIGLGLAGIGFILAAKKGVFDMIPTNPLKMLEESLAVVAVLYSINKVLGYYT